MEEKIKILVIEDNPADVRLINIYLEEYFEDKFSFSSFTYLEKGLEALSKSAFDVIILDLTLPDSAGLETFKKVFEHSPATPIIVLTGLDNELIGINAMKLGAQDFLVKGNIKGKELSRSINYSIERFKLLKELSDNAKDLKKKTEDLLKEQLKLSEAQHLSHIGSWDWDIEKNIVVWSDELYSIYNLDPKKNNISTEKIIKIVHPADKENAKRMMAEAKIKHEPFSFYYRIVVSDSIVKTIQVRGKVIVNDAGQAIKMSGTAQDVSDQIHKEELEKLVLATTQSYNSVIIFDRDQKVEWVNEGFTKFTGYTLNDFKNKPIDIIRGKDSKTASQQQHIVNSLLTIKKPFTYENVNYTKEGEKYWVLTTITPILGKDGEVERFITIESDISLRKKMEEDLLEANKVTELSLAKVNKTLDELTIAKKELEASMKVKGQFMANMSHEIRTPMNAVIGFTDLLLKTPLNQEQKQYIEAVKISGKNLLTIINDILDFSKIESGKLVLEKIKFNLSSAVSTVSELMQPKSVEKNIHLSTKIDPKIPDNLIGDPTRLNQILLNLLGNAIKFTNQGEINISVDLQSDANDMVELKFSIKDTGIGIPKEKLPTLFREFNQVSNETTRKYGGTGLGLAIVKQLVELQEGTVAVESEVNKGSTFSFILKFKKDLSSKVENKETDELYEVGNLEGIHVLLVEDNVLNQILAKKVLTDWKMEVEIAENGLIGIEKLKKTDFDIILMDIQMPEMDGYEATIAIRKTLPQPKNNTPIIAMTAHALSGEAEKCANVGMNDYISKPFEQKVLYSKIYSALKKSQIKQTNS